MAGTLTEITLLYLSCTTPTSPQQAIFATKSSDFALFFRATMILCLISRIPHVVTSKVGRVKMRSHSCKKWVGVKGIHKPPFLWAEVDSRRRKDCSPPGQRSLPVVEVDAGKKWVKSSSNYSRLTHHCSNCEDFTPKAHGPVRVKRKPQNSPFIFVPQDAGLVGGSLSGKKERGKWSTSVLCCL